MLNVNIATSLFWLLSNFYLIYLFIRNDTYCVTGSIMLYVYEPDSADMNKLSYPWMATEGETVEFNCPSLGCFNTTDGLIEWYKVNDKPTTQLFHPALNLNLIEHIICSLTGLQPHPSAAGQRDPYDPCSKEVPRGALHLPAHGAHQQTALQSQQSLSAACARLVTRRVL